MNQEQKNIEAILSKSKDASFDEIMLCAEQVRRDGNVFLIGSIGTRLLDEAQYTVEIEFPINTKKDIIRADERTLKEACLSVLKRYFAATPN